MQKPNWRGLTLRERWSDWIYGMTAGRWALLAFAVSGAAVMIVLPVAASLGTPYRTACGELDARIVSAGQHDWIAVDRGMRRDAQQIAEAEDGRRYLLRDTRDRLQPGARVRILTLCDRQGEKLFLAVLSPQG